MVDYDPVESIIIIIISFFSPKKNKPDLTNNYNNQKK